jgi:tetratricopeptide (TPR) repeat protein/2-polyprenyl-3-methyl-5-hydroxy-6-metoxy-1,4-benzoquinol methylase
LAADLRQLLGGALESHRAGDLEAAARMYRRILDVHPDEPNALNLLAAISLEHGEGEEAVRLLRRAVAVSGEVAQFHCHLGNALQATGEFAAAADAYQQAIALQPENVEALSSLGFALTRLEALPDAIACCRAALAIEPEYFFALNNLGDALTRQGDLEGAADAYRRAMAVQAGVAELHTKLAAVLRDLGHLPDAVEQLWAAIDAGGDQLAAYRMLGSLLRFSQPSAYDPVLEQRLLAFFGASGVDHGDAAEFATALVKLKYAGDPRFDGLSDPGFVVDTLLGDALVAALLTRAVNGDPHLERLLTAARRWLLLHGAPLGEARMPALAVLALQCLNNEHVFAVSEDERQRLHQLEQAIGACTDWGTNAHAQMHGALLLYSMYAPLTHLANAAELAARPLSGWPAALRPVLKRALLDPVEEAALADAIPSLGSIENAVSRAVKDQYEENPYPRWLTPAYRNKADLHGILAGMFPAFEPPAAFKGAIRVLVVGCGTGHHPISIALRYAHARVVATDISRRSLAYGVRMARELGVDNVDFVQNDLLCLSALEGRFDVIECVGVLHHMESMAEGLNMLTTKLSAIGLLKIGLYNHRARATLTRARERIAELGLTARADDIRRFRQMALEAHSGEALAAIPAFGDFYTLSNCRDLLFHVHEQNVTIAALRDLLAAAGLDFIGFESADASLAASYRRRFPEHERMDDLGRWQALEEEQPEAFAGLYQCWCRRRAPG